MISQVFILFDITMLHGRCRICWSSHGRNMNIQESSPPSGRPCSCWRRCMRSQEPDQTGGRRGRGGWGPPCCPHPPSGCGTVRSGSGDRGISTGFSQKSSMARDIGCAAHTLKRPAPFLASPGMIISMVCYAEMSEMR